MLKLSKKMNRLGAYACASVLVGVASGAEQANAAAAAGANKDFNAIAANIIGGISSIPGFITALAYIMGVLFAVLGILKIKDHVENPSQTQLKDGAIRLAVGGALFAIPILLQAMQDLVSDSDSATISAKKMNKIDTFNVTN